MDDYAKHKLNYDEASKESRETTARPPAQVIC